MPPKGDVSIRGGDGERVGAVEGLLEEGACVRAMDGGAEGTCVGRSEAGAAVVAGAWLSDVLEHGFKQSVWSIIFGSEITISTYSGWNVSWWIGALPGHVDGAVLMG